MVVSVDETGSDDASTRIKSFITVTGDECFGGCLEAAGRNHTAPQHEVAVSFGRFVDDDPEGAGDCQHRDFLSFACVRRMTPQALSPSAPHGMCGANKREAAAQPAVTAP